MEGWRVKTAGALHFHLYSRMALAVVTLGRLAAESSELRATPRSYPEHLAWKEVLAEAARAGLGSAPYFPGSLRPSFYFLLFTQ